MPDRPRRPDPLTEIVLRSTAPVETPGPVRPDVLRPQVAQRSARQLSGRVSAEAAPSPRRAASPSGPRQLLIEAARQLLTISGPALSIADAAERAGVLPETAKAEFGEPIALLGAVMLAEVERLVEELGHRDLADALTRAAAAISEHPLLTAFCGPYSAVLAQLSRVDVRAAGWGAVAQAVDAALVRAGRRGTPMVLRWLASYLCAPAPIDDIRADVDILVAGLPSMSAAATWTGRRTG